MAKSITSSKTPVLILYRMNGCGHCELFLPTWKKIATALNSKNSVFAMDIEYSDMKSLPKKFQDVMGFPTVRIIDDSKVVSEYNGPRTKEDVLMFVESYVNSKAPTKPKPATTVTPKTKSKTAKKPKIV